MICPSITMAPNGLVKPEQQRQHGGLAAAGRADQRGHLAGLGDEAHAIEHDLVAAIGEGDVAEFDLRVGQLQRGLVAVVRFARRAVDDLEQLARADQVAVQFDVEACRRLAGS
jgi:hypothetical protein